MKRTLYILVLLPLFLVSCEMIPKASFYIDNAEPVVGEDVFFTNTSHNAVRFEWDFGDNTFTDVPDPVHVYTATGTYEVELTAYSKTGLTDKAYMTIDVRIPTLLEIEVLEYYEEYPVANASVRLYPTLPDWENETSLVSEGFTDEDGITVFSNLGPYVYYVDVWEATHDNYTLKQEDIGFIRTPEVIPHKINRFIAWVDIADHGKGTERRGSGYVIKKLERKPDDKPGTSTVAPSTGDWKLLYDKSVKVR